MGYRTLYIEANQPGNVVTPKSKTEGILENAFWQIALNEDGSLRLVDKDSGVRYDRVFQIEEGSDDGDEYDYSPAKKSGPLPQRMRNRNTILFMKPGRVGP